MSRVLGVILAGGANRRYGAPKALATVGGERIIDRVARAMGEATDRIVLVTNDPATYEDTELPRRPDLRPGTGALGGIHTAVSWAGDTGHEAALVVGCDMPFISGELLARLVDCAGTDLVCLPESTGPRGVEPLSATYGTGCLPAIERTLDGEERAVMAALNRLRRTVIPLSEVARYGDPETIFLNVNRPQDRDRAQKLWAERHGVPGR